jgi:hypothetical protein
MRKPLVLGAILSTAALFMASTGFGQGEVTEAVRSVGWLSVLPPLLAIGFQRSMFEADAMPNRKKDGK